VWADPIKPMLNVPEIKRLKLTCDEPLSNFALKIKLRRYNEAMFSQPRGIDISSDGQTLYVADTGNNRIRAIILGSKAVVTLAGSGVRGFRDGDPLNAQFARPTGVLAAAEGDQVFVADGGNAMVGRRQYKTWKLNRRNVNISR